MVDTCDLVNIHKHKHVHTPPTQRSGSTQIDFIVGTHNDRAYVGKADKIMVPTVKPKDTSAVSLKAAVGGKDGGRRAAYPCSPNEVRRRYASVLKG
jgi:hypothetical protein